MFRLIESNNDTTSMIGAEFYLNMTVPDVIIPIGFSGIFMQCIDIVVIGDNMVEENEVIVYGIVSFSEQDVVRFPGNADSLVINIQDDDGEILIKYKKIALYILCWWDPCMEIGGACSIILTTTKSYLLHVRASQGQLGLARRVS